jgi:hypothetical protein
MFGIRCFLRPKTGSMTLCCFLGISSVWAQTAGTPLPDPYAPIKVNVRAVLPKVGDAPISLNTSARYGDPVPNVARGMAESATTAIQNIASAIQSGSKEITQLDTRLAELDRRVQGLKNQEARVLVDYARGYFCSKCHLAMSEFPSEVAFRQHISEVGAKIIPATAEQTAAKELEFRSQIATLENERANISRQKDQLQSENREAQGQFREALGLWYSAVESEPSFIKANSDEIERQCQAAIQEAQRHLDRISNEKQNLRTLSGSTKDRIEDLNSEEATWKQTKQAYLAASSQNDIRVNSELAVAQENEVREWDQITNAAQQVSGITGVQLPTLDKTLSLSDLGLKLSVSSGPEHLGVNLELNKWTSVGMNVTTTSNTMNAQGFLSLADKIKLQAGVVTSLTPEEISVRHTGGVSTPLGDLDLSPEPGPLPSPKNLPAPPGNVNQTPKIP